MLSDKVRLIVSAIGATLVSGLGDSLGFIHAAYIWQNGALIWNELFKSALG